MTLVAGLLVAAVSGFNAPLLRTAAPSLLHPTLSPVPVAVTRSRPAVPSMLAPQVATGLGVNTAIAALGLATKQKKLTQWGLAHAWALGAILWGTFGWRGWASGAVYFACGVSATKFKMAEKEAKGIAEGRGGMRGPENVWGSGAAASVCALAAVRYPAHAALLRLGFVASLATKLSDTCASEVGKAYGRTTYLITNFKRVEPGTEGAVSTEGTLAGLVGSLVLSGFGVAIGLVPSAAFLPCVAAAFIATNVESLIGALAQDRFAILTNEVVNGIMTFIGAAVGMGIAVALRVAY